MAEQQDVRWIQRFNHFKKALIQLQEAVELARERPLSRLEQQGLIQSFEYTHELAWKTLKDFLENIGAEKLYGSRDTTRAAFKAELIEDGEVWMDMIISRNLTSHTYDEETAEKVVSVILDEYYSEYVALKETLETLQEKTSA
ncbi:MAG TPA: nucleotidyltransferase [Chloroflexi bacterium]|nr:nucleotidyltransferase [Chloroflexota bacterium]